MRKRTTSDSSDYSHSLGVVDECIETYIRECRQKVDPFVANHFSLQEAVDVQKKSLAADLIFYPINALWSIPYVSTKKTVETLDKLGWAKLNPLLEILPTGFKTRPQKEIEKWIEEELLGGREPLLQSLKTKANLNDLLTPEELLLLEGQIQSEISKEVDKYTSSQGLISDLASSVATLVVGRYYFGDDSIGILGMGNHIARKMARDRAADNFFLGKGLGSAFYKVVPVEPSRTQIFWATLGVGLLLTIFSLGIAMISNPLRKKLGLHNKKLHLLLDGLEEKIFFLTRNALKRSQKKEHTLKQVD
ncbi:DUF6635 family protein [Bdellovibrio sp. HCB337]|uniref:DUF6635 family protein n=1 Tax=Bdellovibrio sp. HCB337 TaxID=3394358 RepID=UPI0039A4C999